MTTRALIVGRRAPSLSRQFGIFSVFNIECHCDIVAVHPNDDGSHIATVTWNDKAAPELKNFLNSSVNAPIVFQPVEGKPNEAKRIYRIAKELAAVGVTSFDGGKIEIGDPEPSEFDEEKDSVTLLKKVFLPNLPPFLLQLVSAVQKESA